ncbi:histone-like nucleoid-structuring protein Lsr2 [Microbacterium sp. Marseille-Q6648]|uniref:exonuclease domain-containing protein n=1 Tax=Microbacterium sp. Marseille-Q6648 TaxID=2937991 RepID=UPI00203B1842|nr:histone-like nucleoid-structuring protein Lsr2 [Microbacterium sp. Marseille-Q6648]
MGLFDWLFGKRETSGATTSAPARLADPPQNGVPHFAIIDVETTGLSPRQDRIVELAVVRVDSEGQVVDEWSTRFNPEGPVGATHIHGITHNDVAGAPVFRDVAPHLIPFVAGVPIAAHNANFDLAFLRAEFQRAGWDAPWLPAFCTLDGSRDYLPELDRRRLADCCWAAGVPLEHAHSALGDARATAGLLRFYLTQTGRRQSQALIALRNEARGVTWPAGPSRAPDTALFDRSDSSRDRPKRITPAKPKHPPLLRQMTAVSLLEAVEEGAPEGTLAYLETLLDALEDGEISDEEAGDLGELIGVYRLTDSDLRAAHRAFILALAHKAVDDGHVSADEREELHTLCDALDVPRATVNELIAHASSARAARMSAGLRPLPDDWSFGVPLRVGDKVAFTGCDDRQRDRLERRATELGVRVMNNVSRLTSMLVTDGSMDGTKLAKAREVGTRIVHPDTFETLLAHLQPAAPAEDRPRTTAPTRPAGTAAGTPSRKTERSTSAASPSVVRTWALANGFPVGVRGRISSEIWDAFAAAHATDTTPVNDNRIDARIDAFEFQGEPMAPFGEWAYAPIVPTQAMGLTGGDDMQLSRTREYQAKVRDALNKWEEAEDGELMALLVAEPHHPLIVHAVRADLLVGRERTIAGYLPEPQSAIFHELVKSAMDIGAIPLMKVYASGGTVEQPELDLRLIHLTDDPETPSVTDEIIARTNERRASELDRA